MAKTNLSNHLFLLAATTSVVALLVGFAPPEVDETNFNLQVPLQATSEVVYPEAINNKLPIDSVVAHRQAQKADSDDPLASNNGLEDDEDGFNVTTIKTLPSNNSTVEFDTSPKDNVNYEEHTKTIVLGDSIYKILSPYGVSNSDIYEISMSDAHKKPQELTMMQPGQTITFDLEKEGDKTVVKKLKLQKSLLEQVVFQEKNGDYYKTSVVKKPETIQVYKEVIIKYSLSFDGLKAGIDQTILNQLTNIFGWDIDFALDLRRGDTFSLLYEEKQLNGEHIGYGNILAAQFVNDGKTYQAIRYKTPSGAHYYTPDGRSMRKAFIRAPLHYSRISSPFDLNRIHPIFKTKMPHRGVDYAAPTGTPIKASGDGKIIFKGVQNGYGNVIIINHGRGYTTLYAHMSRFVNSLKRGSTVKQGQVIGYVGMTGYATGPHLHYEFRINGVHKNPVTVKLPNDPPMPKGDLKKYLPYASQMTASLNSYHSPEYMQKLALAKNTQESSKDK